MTTHSNQYALETIDRCRMVLRLLGDSEKANLLSDVRACDLHPSAKAHRRWDLTRLEWLDYEMKHTDPASARILSIMVHALTWEARAKERAEEATYA